MDAVELTITETSVGVDLVESSIELTVTGQVGPQGPQGEPGVTPDGVLLAANNLADLADLVAAQNTLGITEITTNLGLLATGIANEATARGDADVNLAGSIDGHVNDTTAAHAASAVSFANGGTGLASTDVQAAISEVKTYTDGLIASADAMVFKGVIDCSANPNYPAADRGWTYRVSVAGKVGGASGTNVEAGDLLLCLTDGTAAGTQATVGSAWSIAQTNIDGAVTGPASATDGRVATFNGTGGKVIKDGGTLLSDLLTAAAAASTYQPVDSDLTAIAALTTTSFGRSLLELANAGAGRSALGLGSAAMAATTDFDASGAAAAVTAQFAFFTAR